MSNTDTNNLVFLSSKVGSCGHFLQAHDGPEGGGHQVVVRTETPDGVRSVSYRNVCSACRNDYIVEGVLLSTFQEQAGWLSGRMIRTVP